MNDTSRLCLMGISVGLLAVLASMTLKWTVEGEVPGPAWRPPVIALVIVSAVVAAMALAVAAEGKILARWRPERFRFLWFPYDSTWLVFQVGLWATISGFFIASIIGFDFPVENLSADEEGQLRVVLAIVGLIVGFGIGSLVTNTLRFVQLRVAQRSDLIVHPELDTKAESPDERLGARLQELELLIARDSQASSELKWSEEYVRVMNSPGLTKPADVMSIDSQISIRAIYPAALLLWSEQAKVRLKGGKLTWTWGGENGGGWRGNFCDLLRESILRADENFAKLSQMFSRPAPSPKWADRLIQAVDPDRALALRVLIYDYGLLQNEVVRAVIRLHEVLGIPLFYLSTELLQGLGLRSLDAQNGGGEWGKIREIIEGYRALQVRVRNSSEGRWGHGKTPEFASDLEYLWRSSDDDFIIIDDRAWTGYPKESDPIVEPSDLQNDPLLFYARLCGMLSMPGILLASEARALAMQPDGIRVLSEWHRDLTANGLKGASTD